MTKINAKSDNLQKLAGAVEGMLDEEYGIAKLVRLTGVSRLTIFKLLNKKKPTIGINDLYKLMEHGMELDSTQVFLDRVKREKLCDFDRLAKGIKY